MKKVNLNGIEVIPFTAEESLLDFIDRNKGILVAINAEKILHATPQTREIINRNHGYVDGAGVMLALRQKGIRNACKIAGCDLWLKIVNRFYRNRSFYFIGSRKEIIDETVTKLKIEFPGINILGSHDGYLSTPEIRQNVIDDVVRKKPDIVFVAMGSPKQELLMEEIQERHNAIFQGLGGSFDVYTGHVVRAPKWWINHNLEFAYRLIRQPKRIKRQIHLLRFAWWLIIRKF